MTATESLVFDEKTGEMRFDEAIPAKPRARQAKATQRRKVFTFDEATGGLVLAPEAERPWWESIPAAWRRDHGARTWLAAQPSLADAWLDGLDGWCHMLLIVARLDMLAVWTAACKTARLGLDLIGEPSVRSAAECALDRTETALSAGQRPAGGERSLYGLPHAGNPSTKAALRACACATETRSEAAWLAYPESPGDAARRVEEVIWSLVRESPPGSEGTLRQATRALIPVEWIERKLAALVAVEVA